VESSASVIILQRLFWFCFHCVGFQLFGGVATDCCKRLLWFKPLYEAVYLFVFGAGLCLFRKKDASLSNVT